MVWKGPDKRKGTSDDIALVDYTKLETKPPVRVIDGVKYAKLSYSVKTKKRSLKNPEFKFRHAKDKEDIQRIKFKEGLI